MIVEVSGKKKREAIFLSPPGSLDASKIKGDSEDYKYWK